MYRTKKINLNTQEFNDKLKYCSENRQILKPVDQENLGLGFAYAILDVKTVNVSLIYRDYNEKGKIQTFEYRTKLDGSQSIDRITGMDAYIQLRKMCNFPLFEEETTMDSACAFMYKDEKNEGKWLDAYCYDLNSSYAAAMIQDMPDTTEDLGYGIVEEGQIGFYNFDAIMIEPGEEADHRFKLVESPFKRFVEVYYNRKKNATDKAEKQKAKDMLNFAVGYLQRKNPYIRARIIGLANKKIRDLMDENTIYCNTDSITSLTPRNDLDLGEDLGQFKLEHQGQFAYKGFNYQWKNETVSIRGISKNWFNKEFDLLTDELPGVECNTYKFNWTTLQIEEA